MNGITSQMIFSPQNCTLERLGATLTAGRRAEAERIIGQAEAVISSGGSCNVLLLGPRGSGKTHLLHYVRKELEKRYGAAGAASVVALPEEERGIARALDFLVSVLRACGVGRETLVGQLGGMEGPLAVQEACRILREVTGEKPTFVVVENVSDLFDKLGRDALWELRGVLQEHAFVSILASSVQLFADSGRGDHPFHGYFSIRPLKALDQGEAREYLRLVAEANGDRDLANELGRASSRKRMRAIFDLTGGNHRLLAMLATFLTVEGLDELVRPFVQMVDRELTPYYQQRLDRLSPQQYRIVQAIADQEGRALSVKEIAQDAFLPESNVSRLLGDLRGGEFVARRRLGKESYHELREPLLRIVLEMKQGKDSPLPFIVGLLRRWYEADELRQLWAEARGLSRAHLVAALEGKEASVPGSSRAVPVRDMRGGAGKAGVSRRVDESPEGETGLAEVAALLEGADYAGAVRVCERIIVRHDVGAEGDWRRAVAVAVALVAKGMALGQMNRAEEELDSYEVLVERFGESDRPELMERVAWGLVNKGIALRQMNRTEEAITAYDEVVRRFGQSDRPELMEQVARGLVDKGVALAQMGRVEEAVREYEEVVGRFAESKRPELLDLVGRALVNKGVAFGRMGRAKEALTTYDEVVERFGESCDSILLERVAGALFNKGIELGQMGRSGEEVVAYSEVVRRFAASDSPGVTNIVVSSLINKAHVLGNEGRCAEALAACEEALRRRPEDWEAKGIRVLLLVDLGERSKALESAEQVLKSSEPGSEQGYVVLLASLLSRLSEQRDSLRRLRTICGTNDGLVAIAVAVWLRWQIPVMESEVQKLEESARCLRSAFGDISVVGEILTILEAVIADAKGDKTALLALPLEIRHLVFPEKEDEGGGADRDQE